MEKFCRKGHLIKSGKRWLSVLLCVCMIGTMIPVTARAENGTTNSGLCEHHAEHTAECGYVAPTEGHACEHVHDESCGYQEACERNHVHTEECGENGESCTHEHTSECGYVEGHACDHKHDEACGYVESSDGSPCTFVCDVCEKEAEQGEKNLSDENLTVQATNKLITIWQWIDEEEYLDEETGNLALPGASEGMPAYFDDVVGFLPTKINATIENTEDTENPEIGVEENITLGDWFCDNYPEKGAYQGSYTFTATLPEGYVLADGVKELSVMVELGGGSVFAWTPVDRAILQPGSTFDVNTITHGSTLGVDRYTMNQAGATYTITGYNWYDTVARFAVNQSCTIVLDNVTLKAGLTYEDDGVSNYNSGNHGIFEIAENIDVEFVLKGDSKLTAKQYYNDSMAIVSCILLGKGSTVSFSGDGNLDMNGKIARKFYDTTVADARLIMKSGRVSVDGIGNYRVRYAANGNIYSVDTVGGQVQITYEGGSLYNEQDDRTDAYKVEEWRTRNCSGDRYRVRIPINNTSKRTGLKIGADGTYSYIDYPNRGSLYTWHTRTSGKVIDYYVYNGNEYHHYRHTCAGSDGNDWLTEAVEVQDENSICGASGTVTVGGTVAGNETLTFQSQSGSEPFSKSVTTDENGSYYVAMPQGTYKASLKLSGSDTLYDMGTISLTSETKHTFDYRLSVLEGTVRDTSGNNLNNAVIIVSHNGTTYSLITGSDGKYRIVLPKGFAAVGEEISISADYLLSNKETGTVTYSDGIITKDFTLQQSETAEFNIYTEDDLVLLSHSSALLSNKTINLMADISLTGDYPGIKYDSNITKMKLNGNGHSIRNLKKPLFYSPGDTSGTIRLEKCTISDLHLSGDIKGLNDVMYVGALAGGIYETKVEKCTFEGSITQGYGNLIGGLIGNACGEESLIQNCFVHITNFDVKNAMAMGGLCGELSGVRIKNCGVIIDKFGGEMHPNCPNARGAFVGYCYGQGNIRNCYSVVKEKETEVHRIQGNISGSENSVCYNNFSYAPTGVFPDDATDKAHSTDLSAELMIAAAGSGTGDREALIDRLNTYANNYGSWYRRADGYPSPIRGKFTVTYSGGTKGNGSQDAVTVLQEDSVILPGAVYKNADYIQRGWTTTENGEKVYDLDASITPTENMTLYPYWKEKEAAPCTAPTDLSAYYGDTVGSIYLPEGFTWNAPDTLVGNAGAHTFMATYTPTGAEAETYGKNANVQISVTVKKASPNYTTLVSKVSNLTYNRTAQELVTAGTTSDGTIVYSLTEDGTYTTAIPTATNSGNYTVYYKIQGDDNHEDSRVGEISVSIGKASLAGATIILGDSLTFNGETQTQSIASVTVGDMTLGANDYTVTNNTESAVGTYTLTVTGQGNFGGSATKDFAIAKKAAVSVPDIDKKYVYAAGSKGAVISVDIASLLPNDRGVTTYSLATNSAEYVTEKAVGTDGILTYKVGTNGSVNDSTTLTVTVSSDNYEDITVNVNILIMDKYTVVEMEDAKVAITGSNTLTYGQMLSTLTLNTSAAKFVEQENPTKEVTGTLAWKTPDVIANAGTTSATWVFTPEDNAYAELEASVSITVNKATPNVTAAPTVAARTYNPTVSLTNDDLTGGTVTGADGNSLGGEWSWQTANIIPTVDNSGYVAVFTPTDTTNYHTVTRTIAVAVSQATPVLGDVTVTPGSVNNTTDITKVTLARADETLPGVLKLDAEALSYASNTYGWTFTPTDTTNYKTVTGSVIITVNDTIAPTAEYQIGENGWKKFVNTISFGLFCKDYKTVEITYRDVNESGETGSGVKTGQYYIAEKELTEAELADAQWTDYSGTISLNAKGVYFIYVKVEDNAGNSVVLNSEGIVIYGESTLSPTSMDYTYRENTDLEVQIAMNGNTFGKLTDGAGTEMAAENYTIDASGRLTLKAAYLDTLKVGEYTYKVYMNPQGQTTNTVTLAYSFVVKVKACELTVTGATATSRVYDTTNVVAITAVELSGVKNGDDVSVAISDLTGTLSGATSGDYTSVTLPTLTLTGADAGNYTLTQPIGTVPTDVTISKADAEITVGAVSYDKTFGDAEFTLDVTDTNAEADVKYEVTSGADVVSVSNGTVTILKAGSAAITVSLPASTNYNAAEDKMITVNVAKKSGYAVDEVNRSYFYVKNSADTVDFSAMLPADCGNVTYGTPRVTGDLYTENGQPAVSGEGQLSYTVKQAGTYGDSGTIKVTVTTESYADFTITVNVELIDQLTISLKNGSSVTLQNSTLTYGEALSKLAFNSIVFVDDDGHEVTGTLAWKTPDVIANAGTPSATWVFTPDDNAYATVEDIVAITVNKATPDVTALPTVADRTYAPAVSLADADLVGGTVTGADGNSLDGVWSWQTANIIPTVDNSGYEAVFTPTDTTNYETVTGTVTVTVSKATPYIATVPTAAVITYGDTLGASTLSGGTVQYSGSDGTTVAGSFAWKANAVKPSVADSNNTTYRAVFTPSDVDNYNTVETDITLTVNKAENAPNMPSSTMNVANSCTKVSDVTLPTDWVWQDAEKDKALVADMPVTATAVYDGADKGNYVNETVSVTITRSACEHAHTEIRGAQTATCTADGYTGDTYCIHCGVRIHTGTATFAPGHNYTSRVTTEPTTEMEGVMTYTCDRCGHSYTRAIDKLQDTNDNNPGENLPENSKPANNKPADNNPVENNAGENQQPKDNMQDTGMPYIEDEIGMEGWDVIKDEVDKTQDGADVVVEMNGSSVVPGDVLDTIKGKDVTIVFDMGGGITWSVNGQSITGDKTSDIDFSVSVGTNTIPADVIDNVTGERKSQQISLAYEGEFGFTAVLSINMGASNAGLYANLFYYNEKMGELEFICADEIAEGGNTELTFTHASEYAIVIDKEPMDGSAQVTDPDSESQTTEAEAEVTQTGAEVKGDVWNPWWITVIGIMVIVIGLGVFLVAKKMKEEEQK